MHRVGILLVLGMLSLWGCVTAPAVPSNESASSPAAETPSQPSSVPPQIQKSRPLTMETEKRLQTCSHEGGCDRVHFLTALSALPESHDVAAAHFRDVVSTAPKTRLATLSASWLKLLGASAKPEEKQVLIKDTTDWLIAELFKRDKKVEELSKQLNALKQVDLDMKERTSRMKPGITILPKRDSEP